MNKKQALKLLKAVELIRDHCSDQEDCNKCILIEENEQDCSLEPIPTEWIYAIKKLTSVS